MSWLHLNLGPLKDVLPSQSYFYCHRKRIMRPGAQAYDRPGFNNCWLVVWNTFYFSIYWEVHHPKWLSYLSEGFRQPPTRLELPQLLLEATEIAAEFWGLHPCGFRPWPLPDHPKNRLVPTGGLLQICSYSTRLTRHTVALIWSTLCTCITYESMIHPYIYQYRHAHI